MTGTIHPLFLLVTPLITLVIYLGVTFSPSAPKKVEALLRKYDTYVLWSLLVPYIGTAIYLTWRIMAPSLLNAPTFGTVWLFKGALVLSLTLVFAQAFQSLQIIRALEP